jgi:YD repeat-containing protein
VFTRIPQVGKVQLSRRFTACLGYGGAATGSSKTPQTVTYTYDSMGRQYTVADASGTTTYSYDVYGNQTVVASPEGTITYTYDAVTGNHLETQTAYTDTTYSYDTKGELTGVRVNQGNRK